LPVPGPAAGNNNAATQPTPPPASAKPTAGATQYYPYEQLRDKKDIGHLDASKLESYLSDADFLKVMGSDRDTFYKSPPWKQNNKKRQVGLV